MSDISRVALFGKLNNVGYKAIEGATVFCKLRGNPYVEVVHWLHQMLQLQNSDLHCIVKAFALDPGKLASDITETLDRLPRGATSISDLSPHIAGLGRARMGVGDTQVRRHAGTYGLSDCRHAEDAGACENLLGGISREFGRSRRTSSTDELREDLRRFARVEHGRERRHAVWRPGGAGRVQRRHRTGGDGQAGSVEESSRSTSPSRRAAARWTRSSAATTRSARWSTS